MQETRLYSAHGDIAVMTNNADNSKKILSTIFDGVNFGQSSKMFENNGQMKAEFIYQNGFPFADELPFVPEYHEDYKWLMSETFVVVFRFFEECVVDGNVRSYDRGIVRYVHFEGDKEIKKIIDYDKRRDDDGLYDDCGVINVDDYVLDEPQSIVNNEYDENDEIPL